MNERRRNKRKTMTPQENTQRKKSEKERLRKRRKAMTPREREQQRDLDQQRKQTWRQAMTPRENEERRDLDKQRKVKEREQDKQYLADHEWYAAALARMTHMESKSWREKLQAAQSKEEEEPLFKKLQASMTACSTRKRTSTRKVRGGEGRMYEIYSKSRKKVCTGLVEPDRFTLCKRECDDHEYCKRWRSVCKWCHQRFWNIIYSVVR